jgi:hypothetical protein
MLEQERLFYAAHEPEWLETHEGKFVVVKGEELVGIFDSLDEALAAGATRFGLSSFLVRRVGEGEQTVTIPALTLGLLGAHS